MSEDLYTEKLAWFKENEKPEAVLLVADDPQIIRIIVAWTNLFVGRVGDLSSLPGAAEGEIWDWLWQNTVYSRDELLAMSASSEYGFDKKLQRLIGNRVLYPDGTVNSFVQRYLRERVLKLFEVAPKKGGCKAT